MKSIVRFELDDGSPIFLEVDEPDTTLEQTGMGLVGRLDDVAQALAQRSSIRFDQALATVRPAADAVLARLRDLAVSPDTVSLEFGVKLTAAAGAVIASSGLEANFKVTLNWSNLRPELQPLAVVEERVESTAKS